MGDTVIRAEGLSKQYRIGEPQESYRLLRDVVATSLRAPLRWLNFRRAGVRRRASTAERIWALNNISVDISRGEVVGIIGRNGAGKSTFLKVLSRITDPTSGYVDIKGRVGSLLEVGTGFHNELTGRENIFLNGAILGMKRREIQARFDEMVEFAEVSKFIDTPVKHYSSGMFLRLAFSVAAHLEPDILLVDEVLAVGDVAFQRKCLGKMDNVAAEGRTVLFVSHNLAAMKELCRTSLVLSNGELPFRGSIAEGLAKYSQSLTFDESRENGSTALYDIVINGRLYDSTAQMSNGEPLSVEVSMDVHGEYERGQLFCIINDSIGNTVIHQRMNCSELWPAGIEPGSYCLKVELPPIWLRPGIYTLYFKFMSNSTAGVDKTYHSERAIIDIGGAFAGLSRAVLAPPMQWSLAPKWMPDDRVAITAAGEEQRA